MTDIDEYHPPYGVSLPPYSEENPYKEFSPPNYENLATDFREIDSPSVRRFRSRGPTGAASTSCLAEVVVNPCPPGFEDIETDDDGEGYLDHFHHQPYLYSDHRQLSTCLCDVHPHEPHFPFYNPNRQNGNYHERAPSYVSREGGEQVQNSFEMSPQIKRSSHSREVSLETDLPYLIEGESPVGHRRSERHLNVSMTESSGSFPHPSPSPSSNHSHSPALRPSHLRGQRSPLAIQKRTYITWI